jgi:hypothetical protein
MSPHNQERSPGTARCRDGLPAGGPSRLSVAIMPTLEEVVARVVEDSPAG